MLNKMVYSYLRVAGNQTSQIIVKKVSEGYIYTGIKKLNKTQHVLW